MKYIKLLTSTSVLSMLLLLPISGQALTVIAKNQDISNLRLEPPHPENGCDAPEAGIGVWMHKSTGITIDYPGGVCVAFQSGKWHRSGPHGPDCELSIESGVYILGPGCESE